MPSKTGTYESNESIPSETSLYIYFLSNEWKLRGEAIVDEMSHKYRRSLGLSVSYFDIPEDDIPHPEQLEDIVTFEELEESDELTGSETQPADTAVENQEEG